MIGPVATLSDEDMANLAVYFESLPSAAQAVADESLLARGEALYRGGNLEDKTSACLACHGPTGRGNPAAKYPALQGQHAAYTGAEIALDLPALDRPATAISAPVSVTNWLTALALLIK